MRKTSAVSMFAESDIEDIIVCFISVADFCNALFFCTLFCYRLS